MESPKTGVLLLALVAATTASGALLGWHLRPQAPAVAAPKAIIDVSGGPMVIPPPSEPASEKSSSGRQ